ncbi:MAG: SMC-Scp complex subunit ScpB [Planctomycetales bacterium]|nr:SMC-Scp complex subunit ScpB [Planctomycetales bacterium]MCA9164710.1 SMC-Scp complex subunit ScpB [Planctomycetales bacterium]MCA9203499.1 SMC-Scp complex subunit ScpB [Planctomycetales bacterium]MCA9228004.1 SMC-Scp complex subunit ScpB [Planctomycetales bacterium]
MDERVDEDSADAEDLGLNALSEPTDQGLSLEELSQTFAQMLGSGDDPYDSDEAGEAVEEDEIGTPPPRDEEEIVASSEDVCPVTPQSILEAMLFVGHPENESLTAEQVASFMRGVRATEIDDLVKQLNQLYEDEGCPYEIASVGAGYRLQLRDEFLSLREKFFGRVKEAKLSQAAIEVLAVVAYEPGLTREEIDDLRRKPSGALLNQLVRRQLVRIERPDKKPRTPRFFTTDRFLKFFGLSELDELPRSQDLEKAL